MGCQLDSRPILTVSRRSINKHMTTLRSTLAAGLVALAGYSPQAAVLFTLEADLPTSEKEGWRLDVSPTGAYNLVTHMLTEEESIITRDEATFDGQGSMVWDALVAGPLAPGAYIRFDTWTSTSAHFTIPNAVGLAYLHVTFPTPDHIVVEGLDSLGELLDNGPSKAPEGGTTLGLGLMACAALVAVKRHA